MIKKCKKLRLFEIYRGSNIHIGLVIGLLSIMLFHILTICYADITVYARFGLTFLDSIFDGKPFSFYMNAGASGIAPEGAVYDIGLYFIYGIWNLPLWLLNKFVDVNPVGTGSLLWYKILLVMFMVFCMIRVYDISKLLGLEEKKASFVTLCFGVSLLTFMPIFVASQCDVIPLAFCLNAVYWIFNGNKFKMLIYSAFALLTKPFSLLMLVLLVVLYEKNIMKILIQVLLGTFPMLFCKALYSMVPGAVKSSEAHIMSSLEQFLEVQMPSGNGQISLFVVGYGVLIVIAYLSNRYIFDEEGNVENVGMLYYFRRTSIIYLFFMWLNFCVFARIYPYWAIYLAPFAIWVMLLGKDIEKSMLLELVFEIGLTLMLIMNFSWVYGGEKAYTYTILSGMIKNVVETTGGVTVAGMLRQFKIDMLLPAINAVTVVCGVVIGVLALRDNNSMKEVGGEENESKDELTKLFNIQYVLRVLVIGVWLLMSLATFIVTIMS